jgi:hypothetical protein
MRPPGRADAETANQLARLSAEVAALKAGLDFLAGKVGKLMGRLERLERVTADVTVCTSKAGS